jgi:hypothetical protein
MTKKDIELCMTRTVGIVLDFFLDIFDMAPTERRIENLKEQLETIDIQERGYEVKLWALYLWNDESHSFQEVIDEVMEVLKYSQSQAKLVAETVDRVVRVFLSSISCNCTS